jgi:hypothetical protein
MNECDHFLRPRFALLFPSRSRNGNAKARSVQLNVQHLGARLIARNVVRLDRFLARGIRMIEWCHVLKERRLLWFHRRNRNGNAKSLYLFSFAPLLQVRVGGQNAVQ